MTREIAAGENFDVVRGNQTVRVPFDDTEPAGATTGTLARLSDVSAEIGQAASALSAELARKQVKLAVPGGTRWTFSTESAGAEMETFMAGADGYAVEAEDADTGKKYTLTGYDEAAYFVPSTVKLGDVTTVSFFVFDTTETEMYGRVTAAQTAVCADVPAEVDPAPVEGSGRLTTSGGVWSALDGKLDKSGGEMTGPLTAQRFVVPNGDAGGFRLNYADFNATVHYNGAAGVYIGVKQGSSGTYYIRFQDKGGAVALAAPNPIEDNLAALDADGNPVDSGIGKAAVVTNTALSGETLPADPSPEEMLDAFKKMWKALGGAVSGEALP